MTQQSPEDLREITGAAVADFDGAARVFADQLRGAIHTLADHELEWGHSGGLLENVGWDELSSKKAARRASGEK